MCGFNPFKSVEHIVKNIVGSPIFQPLADGAAILTGNPELIPLINGGSALAQGQGIGGALKSGGEAFLGQEIGSSLGSLFPETLGGAFGTEGNSFTDLAGLTNGGGSFFGPNTIGGDLGNLFQGSGVADVAGFGGGSTPDAATNAARDATSSGASTPLDGASAPSSGVSDVGGGTSGGFVSPTADAAAGPVYSPDGGSVNIDGGNVSNYTPLSQTGSISSSGFANAPDIASGGSLGDASSGALNTPSLAQQFQLPGVGATPFESDPSTLASSIGGSVSSNNYAQAGNGLLRSGLTSLFANTNQKGYQGENAAAQQAAAAYQPFLQNGTQASNTLASLYGNNGADAQAQAQQGFTNTPGYQFALNQGIQAQDASAAARGQLLSGNQQKALTDYGTGLANQTYQQYVSNLQNQAGVGAQAAGGYGSALVGGANALAQGGQASANNQNQGIGGAIGSLFPGNDILSLLKGNYGNNSVLSSLFS